MPEQQNRRRHGDLVIDELRRELNEYRIESRHDRLVIKQQIKCLYDGFTEFKSEYDAAQLVYRPYLDTAIRDKAERQAFIAEKIKAWRSRAFDIAAIFVGLMAVYSLTAAEFWARIWAKVKALV